MDVTDWLCCRCFGHSLDAFKFAVIILGECVISLVQLYILLGPGSQAPQAAELFVFVGTNPRALIFPIAALTPVITSIGLLGSVTFAIDNVGNIDNQNRLHLYAWLCPIYLALGTVISLFIPLFASDEVFEPDDGQNLSELRWASIWLTLAMSLLGLLLYFLVTPLGDGTPFSLDVHNIQFVPVAGVLLFQVFDACRDILIITTFISELILETTNSESCLFDDVVIIASVTSVDLVLSFIMMIELYTKGPGQVEGDQARNLGIYVGLFFLYVLVSFFALYLFPFGVTYIIACLGLLAYLVFTGYNIYENGSISEGLAPSRILESRAMYFMFPILNTVVGEVEAAGDVNP